MQSDDSQRLGDLLADVFRTHGYDGTSLALISEATGLQRSSLYHHFPGGKQQMAASAMRAVGTRFGEEVLVAPRGARSPQQRIAAIAAALDRFYAGGTRPCLLDTLTIGDAGDETAGCIRAGAHAWIGAFRALAREAGLDARAAKEQAEDAVAAIEGALILARATGNTDAFRRALRGLEARLTQAPAPAPGQRRPKGAAP